MSVSPMLAHLAEQPFNQKGWLFEIKWDGYRAIAYKEKGGVKLLSRNQKSFNDLFPSIVDELKKLPGRFILDGEIVILDKKGRSHFQLLQNYQKRKEGIPYYYVFDILSLNGKNLTRLPLIKRKAILIKELKRAPLSQIRISEHIEEQGKKFFQLAKKLGLEGIMAKREESPYQERRSRDWLKIKTKMRQEVIVGGYTQPKGSRKKFGALLVGVYEKGHLIYVGHVGGGFNEQLLSDVFKELQKIKTARCPFQKEPHPNTPATWVKPKLVCEVAFAEWTNDGIMRQPIFKGLRTDKSAIDVVKEHYTK